MIVLLPSTCPDTMSFLEAKGTEMANPTFPLFFIFGGLGTGVADHRVKTSLGDKARHSGTFLPLEELERVM